MVIFFSCATCGAIGESFKGEGEILISRLPFFSPTREGKSIGLKIEDSKKSKSLVSKQRSLLSKGCSLESKTPRIHQHIKTLKEQGQL